MSNPAACNPEAVMRLAPVVPVLVIEDVAHAVPVAQALVAGGLPALRDQRSQQLCEAG